MVLMIHLNQYQPLTSVHHGDLLQGFRPNLVRLHIPRHSSDLPPTASTFPTGGTTCPAVTWCAGGARWCSQVFGGKDDQNR